MENRHTQTNVTALEVPNYSTSLKINSERQYRLLFAILEQSRATNELIQIGGANNVPDVVASNENCTEIIRKQLNNPHKSSLSFTCNGGEA